MEEVLAVNALAVRETLGWSRDRLARAGGVNIAAVYLLERLGSDGTPDDQQLLTALGLAARQRVAAAAVLAKLAIGPPPNTFSKDDPAAASSKLRFLESA